LAADIIERMHARRSYLGGAAAETAMDSYIPAPAAGACNQADATVAGELRCWLQAIVQSLPSGTGTITRESGAANLDPSDDVYRVCVQWVDRSQQTSSIPCPAQAAVAPVPGIVTLIYSFQP
jgi:hypothetical protein